MFEERLDLLRNLKCLRRGQICSVLQGKTGYKKKKGRDFKAQARKDISELTTKRLSLGRRECPTTVDVHAQADNHLIGLPVRTFKLYNPFQIKDPEIL